MTLLLVIMGFALLGLGTYRQSQMVFAQRPSAQRRFALLCGGYAVLALSLLLAVSGPDAARQSVQWFGLLTIGALVMLIGFWLRGGR
jgi:hypothetical protein